MSDLYQSSKVYDTMKILYAIEGIRKATGTAVFCGEILNYLIARGCDCRLLSRNQSQNPYSLDVRIRWYCKNIRQVFSDGWKPDVVHIHALWHPWLMLVFLMAKLKGIPIVWSIHGGVAKNAFKESRLKKQLVLKLYLKWALKHCNLLHCTTETEVEDVRRLGIKMPCVVAPLGVELKTVKVERTGKKKCLYLSRIDYKKGIENLIAAWQQIYHEGWELLLAGPIEDEYARDLVKRTQSDSIRFLGAVYGEEKDKLFAKADLFVLPTFTENFGVVVVEALAAGVPVITTKGAPWAELEKHGCGKWIEIGVEPLIPTLREMIGLSNEARAAMGARGRKLVEERFLWPAIAEKMKFQYEKLI